VALLERFPYLGMSLALFGLLLAGLLACPRERRRALLSAALQAPFGLLSVFFVPDYWTPVRVFSLGDGAGVEDLLFSFSSGGLAWLLATSLSSSRIEAAIEPRKVLTRFAAFAVPGVTAGALLWRGGLGPMDAALAVAVVSAAVLAFRQRGLLRLSAAGGVGFGILYSAVLKGAYTLWPRFADQWAAASRELTVLGLPLEEVVWATGGGAVWPLFVAHLVDARVTGAGPGPRRGRERAPYSERSAATGSRRTARHAG
jgi:hypothetical protein